MAEWFKAHAWKVCVPSQVPWVRIPLSPPIIYIKKKQINDILSTNQEKKGVKMEVVIVVAVALWAWNQFM